VEPHRGTVGKPSRERAEPGKRLRRSRLVEPADGGRDLCLGVRGRLARRRREDALGRALATELLERDAVEELAVDAPHECFAFLEASAFSPTFLIYLHAPAYWKRLLAASDDEAREAYALFRRQVQIFLVRAQGRRWLSKSPAHMGFLDSLAGAFPDCAIVSTRREPLESIPSLCSLTAMVRSVGSDDVRPAEIGREIFDGFVESARREEAAQAALGPGRVHDVAYARLAADPMGVVRDIYERYGFSYTQVFERRMQAWLAAHPRHAHGVHEYSLEQFGLDREEVFEATDGYRRRYLADAIT